MPIHWTPETHETLLVAIIKSTGALNPHAIITAWPAHKGPPPTLSALTQHITGLKKKVNANPGTGAASPSATGTFATTPKSRGRPSKNSLFSGSAAKGTRLANDSDDSEGGEEGDTCASTASPTPATSSALGKRVRKKQEGADDDIPADVKKGGALMAQLRAAASQTQGAVKQEPAWSSEGVAKKAKREDKD
ncbi:hypothetical protein E2P81_ATG08939 [Venturia nashicola]|uniref:Uncharacterized protein n=1 Tax=Venturia nashicola TaxID=86259 RepID=A0A4Z1P5D3_9PEZI|nr:hypothetical protein E6O75_ATG09138 [Venturia nashicola]TLD23595.1 hypothetical protein E2P81_ATG08939 [Venturia nashicola]